jgi:hypothetical protein
MSTVPLLTETPLDHLLDDSVGDTVALSHQVADPYARWHRFLISALMQHEVVATVAQILSSQPNPARSLQRR